MPILLQFVDAGVPCCVVLNLEVPQLPKPTMKGMSLFTDGWFTQALLHAAAIQLKTSEPVIVMVGYVEVFSKNLSAG